MTLEDYLRKCWEGGEWKPGNAIDHALRHEVVDGEVRFYIHPSSVSGPTVNFTVKGNQLVTRELLMREPPLQVSCIGQKEGRTESFSRSIPDLSVASSTAESLKKDLTSQGYEVSHMIVSSSPPNSSASSEPNPFW